MDGAFIFTRTSENSNRGLILVNHRLPPHLKEYDSPSTYDLLKPNTDVLSVEPGGLPHTIYHFAKTLASCIFHDFVIDGIGTAQHHALAILGREVVNWNTLWRRIWTEDRSINIGAETPGTANDARILLAHVGVKLMLAGFPRLDICSPHRVQVFAQGVDNRQGYHLRIHHSKSCKTSPGWKLGTQGTYFDTPEISSSDVQEKLIRLRLPREGVPLVGCSVDMKLLGAIRIAHEILLHDWSTEADQLLRSLSNHRQAAQPGTQPRDANQQLLHVNTELLEIERYFPIMRRIQEVFVLNELVLQCTLPLGSTPATGHFARLKEYTERVQLDDNAMDESGMNDGSLGLESKALCNEGEERNRRKRREARKKLGIYGRSYLYQYHRVMKKDPWYPKPQDGDADGDLEATSIVPRRLTAINHHQRMAARNSTRLGVVVRAGVPVVPPSVVPPLDVPPSAIPPLIALVPPAGVSLSVVPPSTGRPAAAAADETGRAAIISYQDPPTTTGYVRIDPREVWGLAAPEVALDKRLAAIRPAGPVLSPEASLGDLPLPRVSPLPPAPPHLVRDGPHLIPPLQPSAPSANFQPTNAHDFLQFVNTTLSLEGAGVNPPSQLTIVAPRQPAFAPNTHGVPNPPISVRDMSTRTSYSQSLWSLFGSI